jgi:EAL domain-containing protein (putative c-di-GMP-specific phosphodiesterase class I)
LLAPAAFLASAERHGLLSALDLHVLTTALLDSHELRRYGSDGIRVGVNFSPDTLNRSDLRDVVEAALLTTGTRADFLSLEITESSAISDMATVVPALTQLRALGAEVALDDFGTGYSSLSYLQELPIDVLKLDKTFVKRQGSDGELSSIVETVVRLGHQLGMKVVAEGIETDQQFRALQSIGCEAGQGWLFARPMPIGQAVPWLVDHRASPASGSSPGSTSPDAGERHRPDIDCAARRVSVDPGSPTPGRG